MAKQKKLKEWIAVAAAVILVILGPMSINWTVKKGN